MSKKNNWEDFKRKWAIEIPDRRLLKSLFDNFCELLEEAREEKDVFWENVITDCAVNARAEERQKLREMIQSKINQDPIELMENTIDTQSYNQALEELLKELK